jgi:DNA polymerase-3 subunit beta
VHIVIPKSALIRELSLLNGIAKDKSTIPILSNVLLDAADGRLSLTATDLENGLVCTVECDVREPGRITLPAKRLHGYVSLLPDTDVTIKTTENQYAKVSAGKSRSNMAGESPEAFPVLLKSDFSLACSVDARTFNRLLNRVRYAISDEETKYGLKAALVDFGVGLRLVATDGNRLAYTLLPGAEYVAKKFLMPKKAADLYAKLVNDSQGGTAAEITDDENHILIRIGHRTMVARKLNGTFPDWERILSRNFLISLDVDRDDLLGSIRRVSQFSTHAVSEKLVTSSIALRLKDGSIEVAAASAESGEADESVQCAYQGAEIGFGFNPQYLTDFLSVVETDLITVLLKDANSSVEFRPAGREDFRYVAAPKRL